MALSTWRLTGRVLNPAGQAVVATLILRPIPAVVHDPTDGDVTASVVRLTTRVSGDPVLARTELPADLVTADGLHYVLSVEPRLWPAVTFAAPTAGSSLALDDIVPSIPTPIPTVDAVALRAEWQAAIAMIEPSAGVSEAVVSPTQGTVSLTPVHGCTHTLTLTGDAEITLDPAPGGTIATLAVTYAGHALTVDGTTWTAAVLVLHRYGGVWHVTAAGESVATPIPDTVAPTAGTLTASAVTASGATLTVTGAADETALHATAYSFSLDGGTTWLPWQAGATYAAALAASTTCTVAHRVRDAAGNITVGTPIEVTTPAASDTTAPTAPNLSVDATSQTQLVATVTGGTDAVGVTQRRVRLDGGAWEVLTVATTKTYAGLTAGSAHTIDAQAGDAAGNWSVSASWSGSTAAPTITPLLPADLAGLYAHFDMSDSAKVTTASGFVTSISQAALGASPSTLSGAGVAPLNNPSAGSQIVTSTVNGLAAVRVPSTVNIGTSAFPSPQPAFTAATIFHVFKAVTLPTGITGWTLANLPQAGIGQGGTDGWQVTGLKASAGGISDTNTVAGQTYVQVSTHSGGVTKIYRSNWGATVSSESVAGPGTHYFSYMGGGGATLDHCQWGVYDRALSGAEVEGLMAGLKARWGVA